MPEIRRGVRLANRPLVATSEKVVFGGVHFYNPFFKYAAKAIFALSLRTDVSARW
jgi:hypothetical protein